MNTLNTLTNSNQKNNTLDRSITFTNENSENKTNTVVFNNLINNSNIKNSLNNLGPNISNSTKSNKNTIPERAESGSFMNLSIGFDRMSHANFTTNNNTNLNNINKSLDMNSKEFMQNQTVSQSNKELNNKLGISSKDNIIADNNLCNQGKFIIWYVKKSKFRF